MPLEEPVTFISEEQQIVGIWHEPVRALHPAPAVVLCHGFTGHKSESHRLFVSTGRALARSGIGALRFDFRGSGDSAGESETMTVAGEVADARAALAYLQDRAGVDGKRIGLLGLSLGGMIAALTLPLEPDIRAVSLWNPVADPEGVARRRRTERSDRELVSCGVADYHGWAVGPAFLRELPELRPVESLVSGGRPVLIVLGDQDESVPNAEGLRYADTLRKGEVPVDVEIIKGGGHTFESLDTKKAAITLTVNWLTRALRD